MHLALALQTPPDAAEAMVAYAAVACVVLVLVMLLLGRIYYRGRRRMRRAAPRAERRPARPAARRPERRAPSPRPPADAAPARRSGAPAPADGLDLVKVRRDELHEVLARLQALEAENEELQRVIAGSAPAAVPEPAPLSPRQATREALDALPRSIAPDPFMPVGTDAIPMLFDGTRWHAFSFTEEEHWGVFGASGTGKSTIVKRLGLSVLALGPAVAELWVLDTKMGMDYAGLLQIQHARLYSDVRDESGTYLADGSLAAGYDALEQEISRRSRLLFGRAASLAEYNATAETPLPYLLVVAEEAAELSKPLHGKLETLARQARSFGITIMVSTHYPTADVLSGQIQANLRRRLVLHLPAAQASVALGLKGGLEHYDPASLPPRGVGILRVSSGVEALGAVPHLTRDEWVRAIARLAARYGRPQPPADPPATPPPASGGKRQIVVPPEEWERIQAAYDQHRGVRTAISKALYNTDGGEKYQWVKAVCDTIEGERRPGAGGKSLVEAA